MAISNLLKASRSEVFEEAKEEWIVESVIDESSDEFSGCCHLCNTSNLKYNFVLYNSFTDERIQIGTTCIIRFGVGKGIYDIQSGLTVLQGIVDEQYLTNELQTSINSVMILNPDARELYNFTKNLRKLMELKGVKNPTQDQLGEIFYGSSWRNVTDIIIKNRVSILWEKPGIIETIKHKNVKYQSNPKEGTTFGYKHRKKLTTHFGSSEIYHVEDYVTKKLDR